jgi:hypothetical protein
MALKLALKPGVFGSLGGRLLHHIKTLQMHLHPLRSGRQSLCAGHISLRTHGDATISFVLLLAVPIVNYNDVFQDNAYC